LKKQHGGARRRSGRPKGSKNTGTLAKEAARELVRQVITEQIRPLVEGQVANALGIRYLVSRDVKTGKFLRVANVHAKIKARSNEEIIEVWEKDPCVESFKTLLDRALDKPMDRAEVSVTEDWGAKAAFLASARRKAKEAGD